MMFLAQAAIDLEKLNTILDFSEGSMQSIGFTILMIGWGLYWTGEQKSDAAQVLRRLVIVVFFIFGIYYYPIIMNFGVSTFRSITESSTGMNLSLIHI